MVDTALETAFLSIADVQRLLRGRELSPVELVTEQLARIERLQPVLRAYLTVTADTALAQARAAEAALLAGDTRPLVGVPLGYKDIYTTAGVRTTGGSELFLDTVPEITATTIVKLQDAGAVMLGKLQTHEFALGLTPEEHPLPPTRNPWDTTRIPGGSSSGSGAALAAGIAFGALGSDTGGSIRGPAAYCGIAGLKPTYGRCSRYGVYTLAWSLDHTGPMARTVEDCALLLGVMAGHDPKDPASARVPVGDYTSDLGKGVRGLRIGVPRAFFAEETTPEVAQAFDAALETLRALGAEVREIDWPALRFAAVNSLLITVEAFAYHEADLRATPEKFAPQLRNRMRSGGLYLSSEYVQAQRARRLMIEEARALLREVDLFALPSTPRTAPTFEEAYALPGPRRPAGFTGPFNMTGLPALSVCCGFDTNGLPIGLQLAGRPFDEATVLRAGHTYERAAGWHTRHPAL
jgi:aspartyl-tRNA(Asn)/glutamyl-tRNA(Gln) amidotransferase subunit A